MPKDTMTSAMSHAGSGNNCFSVMHTGGRKVPPCHQRRPATRGYFDSWLRVGASTAQTDDALLLLLLLVDPSMLGRERRGARLRRSRLDAGAAPAGPHCSVTHGPEGYRRSWHTECVVFAASSV